jgi:hypothetical protein
LADVIKRGQDPHCNTAASILRVELAEFMGWKDNPTKVGEETLGDCFKKYRQRAKPVNFGVPGSFGVDSLQTYARLTYGVVLTREETKEWRDRLIHEIYPELSEYLDEDAVTILARNLGVPTDGVRGVIGDTNLTCFRKILAGDPKRRDGNSYDEGFVARSWAALLWAARGSALLPALQARYAEGDNLPAEETKEQTKERKRRWEDLARRVCQSGVTTLTGRIRGRVRYSQARNTPFQGLAADGAALALFALVREGFKVTGFVHDETLFELPDEGGYVSESVVRRIEKIKKEAMTGVLGCDIPVSVESALSVCWSKEAKLLVEDGRVYPWRPLDDFLAELQLAGFTWRLGDNDQLCLDGAKELTTAQRLLLKAHTAELTKKLKDEREKGVVDDDAGDRHQDAADADAGGDQTDEQPPMADMSAITTTADTSADARPLAATQADEPLAMADAPAVSTSVDTPAVVVAKDEVAVTVQFTVPAVPGAVGHAYTLTCYVPAELQGALDEHRNVLAAYYTELFGRVLGTLCRSLADGKWRKLGRLSLELQTNVSPQEARRVVETLLPRAQREQIGKRERIARGRKLLVQRALEGVAEKMAGRQVYRIQAASAATGAAPPPAGGVDDVLAGRASWAVVQADRLDFLNSLPADSVDLLVTSPPYESQRSYGINFAIAGELWVTWMFATVQAALRVTKGLVAVVCEGQTRDFRYSGVPYLLLADLIRSGVTTRKPLFYRRVGIPGSGSVDWLRADAEPVLCFTRGGRLPWADPTACGKPPKFPPGGRPSHRRQDGRRVNKNAPNGTRNGDTLHDKDYKPPKLANPGCVVEETYTAQEVAELLDAYEASTIIDTKVGGGRMATDAEESALASRNEAPFGRTLADFMVRTFCPPGGAVADCFAGSGTTLAAADAHGRRAIGCDVRLDQVELAKQRINRVIELVQQGGTP